MTIRNKIILSLVVLVTAFFAIFVYWVLEEVKPRYLEALEEPLVDLAYILSSEISSHSTGGMPETSHLKAVLDEALGRTFRAKIYLVVKNNVDLHVYVTDRAGIVLFDSQGGKAVGQGFSRWNDVFRSLNGEYGARSTRSVPDQPTTGVLYVSAPIFRGSEIIGVVSVGKPVERPLFFIALMKTKLMILAGVILVSMLGFASVTAAMVVRPLQHLTEYARAIRDGRKPALLARAGGEVGELQAAFEEMRTALEGKEYVERYVQSLTHELKSPLAAIRGSAELLAERIPEAERTRFAANLVTESERMAQMVDRMLSLAAIEKQRAVEDPHPVELGAVVSEVAAASKPVAEQIGARIVLGELPALRVQGDRFLVRQAIMNLVQNAMDFAPEDSSIGIRISTGDGAVRVHVSDQGPGVPEYAAERIFERFYSLPRPSTGRKSTGLGLPFVKEVALLHGGAIKIRNPPEGGTEAILSFPIAE